MSKKRDKSTKDDKDKKDRKHKKDKKRCKSKKADDQKWERPDGYYKEYETRRRGEGHTTKLRIKALLALLLEIYSPVTTSEMRMISYMVCLVDPRVSLPFIPSTCLIPTDTSRNTTHIWIKNHSLKILPDTVNSSGLGTHPTIKRRTM